VGCYLPGNGGGGGGGLLAKSCLTLATPWTIARQAPLSMRFSSKNSGVGCHFLPGRSLSFPLMFLHNHCHLLKQSDDLIYKCTDGTSLVVQ